MNTDQFKLLSGELTRIVQRIDERREELETSTNTSISSLNKLKGLIETDGISQTLYLLQEAISKNARNVNQTFSQITQFINSQKGLHTTSAETATKDLQSMDSILGNIKSTTTPGMSGPGNSINVPY